MIQKFQRIDLYILLSTPTTFRYTARRASSTMPAWPYRVAPIAQWKGVCGVQFQSHVDALKAEIFKHCVLHADETLVQMLNPGDGETHRVYL